MGFPFTPRSMTLNCCKVKLAEQMKMDPYCQQWNCSPLNVLFSDVQIALISQVVPQLGGVKQR